MSDQPQNVVSVKVADIKADPGVQSRVSVNADVVADYERLYRDDMYLPPVTLIRGDDGVLWLADGFHRLAAAIKAGLREIGAIIIDGDGRRAAILESVGSNHSHGVHRTREDKRKAVLMLLADEEWAAAASTWIAEKAGVSDTFVGTVRNEKNDKPSLSNVGQRRIGKNGKSRRVIKSNRTSKNRIPPSKPAPSRPETQVESKPVGNVHAAIVEDELGRDVPAPLRPAADGRGQIVALSTELTRWVTKVEEKLNDPGFAYVADVRQQLMSLIQETQDTLRAARFYGHCGSCLGSGCGECQGRGWVPHSRSGKATLSQSV